MRTFGAIVCLRVALANESQANELSEEERALCRPDVIRYCQFKLRDLEALRQCLRDNREKLSTLCRGLLKSRGN